MFIQKVFKQQVRSGSCRPISGYGEMKQWSKEGQKNRRRKDGAVGIFKGVFLGNMPMEGRGSPEGSLNTTGFLESSMI